MCRDCEKEGGKRKYKLPAAYAYRVYTKALELGGGEFEYASFLVNQQVNNDLWLILRGRGTRDDILWNIIGYLKEHGILPDDFPERHTKQSRKKDEEVARALFEADVRIDYFHGERKLKSLNCFLEARGAGDTSKHSWLLHCSKKLGLDNSVIFNLYGGTWVEALDGEQLRVFVVVPKEDELCVPEFVEIPEGYQCAK